MRKLTSLLMLLCVFVGTAWAQGVKLEDLSEDKAYLLKNVASNFYMTVVNDDAAGIQIKNFSNEDNQWFYVLKSETEGYFNIKTKNGKFLLAVEGWDFKTSDTACDFEIKYVEGTEGEYTIHRKEGGSGGNKIGPNKGATNDGAPLYSNHTDDNTNCNWVFEEEGVKAIKVTYKYFIDGKFYTSQEKNEPIKSEVNVPAQAFLAVVDYQGTIGEEDCEITVNCKEDLPFVSSASYENAIWQVIDMHSNENNYTWKFVAEDAPVETPVVAKSLNEMLEDEYYWAFVGNLLDGFKIYNKKAGGDLTLRKAETGNTISVMSSTDDKNQFKVYSSTKIDGAFCFKLDGDNYYLNKQAQDGKNILKGW